MHIQWSGTDFIIIAELSCLLTKELKFSKSRIMLVQLLWWQMLIHYVALVHDSHLGPEATESMQGSQAPCTHQRSPRDWRD